MSMRQLSSEMTWPRVANRRIQRWKSVLKRCSHPKAVRFRGCDVFAVVSLLWEMHAVDSVFIMYFKACRRFHLPDAGACSAVCGNKSLGPRASGLEPFEPNGAVFKNLCLPWASLHQVAKLREKCSRASHALRFLHRNFNSWKVAKLPSTKSCNSAWSRWVAWTLAILWQVPPDKDVCIYIYIDTSIFTISTGQLPNVLHCMSLR